MVACGLLTIMPRLREQCGRRGWGRVVLAVWICITASGVGHAAPSSESFVRPRLVVLYATCSLNKEYLSPYQLGVRYTPSIAAFAEKALVFDRHQTEAGQSGPAFASLFTGVRASTHGILRHPYFLDESLFTITEAYADAGYDVHTWLQHLMASSALHYDQGVAPENQHPDFLRADDPAFLAILDRLARDPDYKALVVTNFTVTHSPYSGGPLWEFCHDFFDECTFLQDQAAFAHDQRLLYEKFLPLAIDRDATFAKLGMDQTDIEHFARTAELLYKADVYHLDELFGAVVEAIDSRGLADQSLVVFTADHGEILYRKEAPLSWSHGHQLAPEVLSVPLLLRGPSVKPGRYQGVTRSIDVFPTLAGLSGIDVALPEGEGKDLSATVRDGSAPPRQLAYSHSALYAGRIEKYPGLQRLLSGNRPSDLWVAVRDGDRLFVLRRFGGGPWQPGLFDLSNGPSEKKNLYDPSNPEHREMVARLEAYKQGLITGHERMRARREERERAERHLRQLGYIE